MCADLPRGLSVPLKHACCKETDTQNLGLAETDLSMFGNVYSDPIYQENGFELNLQCWEQLASKSVYSCHQGIKISCGNSPGTWKHNAEEVWQALQWLKAYHGIPCLLHGILDPWGHL